MRERRSRALLEPLARVVGIFAVVGFLLFIRVWWPIQAERNLVSLKKIETQVFQRKSELNDLNEKYIALTSLTVLDQWAKRHGPWIPPNAQNVIPIQ
jgi:hypothetical protein